MEELNQEIRVILTKAEFQGTLGATVTGNLILDAFKRHYHDPVVVASAKERIEALKKEPGVSFPENYEEILTK